MSSSVQNGSLAVCAISLEHKDDFCASPPFGFHVAENNGRMVCEDTSVIVLVRDTKFEGRDVVIEVETFGSLFIFYGANPIELRITKLLNGWSSFR